MIRIPMNAAELFLSAQQVMRELSGAVRSAGEAMRGFCDAYARMHSLCARPWRKRPVIARKPRRRMQRRWHE